MTTSNICRGISVAVDMKTYMKVLPKFKDTFIEYGRIIIFTLMEAEELFGEDSCIIMYINLGYQYVEVIPVESPCFYK